MRPVLGGSRDPRCRWWLPVLGLMAIGSAGVDPAQEPAPPVRKAGSPKAEASRGNPPHSDPAAELMRLRLEGRANFEGGITLKFALPLFEAAVKLSPQGAVELFNLGVTQWKLKSPAARANLEKAMAADPLLPNPPYVLALLDKAAGNSEGAARLLEKARELAPGEPSIHYQLASLYRALGREEAALQALTHVAALDPYHTGALYQIYQYHRRNGTEERATDVFKEFSRLKRAASSSRKEVNYEEGPLALPVVGAPQEAASALDRRGLKLALTVERLELKEAASAADLRDLDRDGREDVVAVGASGAVHVLRNRAAGFQAVRIGAAGDAVAAAGAETLVAESFIQKAGPGVIVGGPKGLAYSALDLAGGPVNWRSLTEGGDRPLAVFDADHDGDLDVLAQKGPTVWLNRGNAEFFAEPAFLGAALKTAVGAATGVVAAPFAGSDGVDLLLWSREGRRQFVRDGYGGLYELVEARPSELPELQWTEAADLDNDGRPDLVSLAGGGRLVVEWNRGGFKLEMGPAVEVPAGAGRGAVGDFDNDGFKDVLVLQEGAPPLLVANLGKGRFEPSPVGTARVPTLRQAPIVTDIDGDGRLDVLALSSTGEIQLWRNTSQGVGHAFALRLEGIRSVPSGAATTIETRIGGRYQRVEAQGRLVHVGLGPSDYAEVLRITWPNGFVENKFKVESGRVWTFKESERVSGSCPTLFAWNGERFGFVTDAFISGPMGVPMARGRYFPVDHDEWIKIPGRALKARQGRYEIRITEELRETTYIDQARLFAVDHPADVTVLPNERLGPFPPSSFHLFGSGGMRPPLTAVDDRGNDVRELIRAVDLRYPRNVVHSQYAGLARPNWIAFDLPETALRSPHLRLFLTGWFYYFESTSLISLSQRTDLGLAWPEVQALCGGQWTRVEIAGVMPGKHKTLVVDLAGKVPPCTERLRIWSNVAIYWDAILYDDTPARDADHRLVAIPLRGAHLRFRGFSELQGGADPSVPEHFVYDRPVYVSMWNPMQGRLTRYGDVGPLVNEVDSLMAVFSSGDELALTFEGEDLQPPPGWSRDYLLYLHGYVKDGDAYTAYAGQISPMPFKGMKTFPYDEAQLREAPFETEGYRRYAREYQTRLPLQFTGPRLSPPSVPRGPGEAAQ